ncbi:MAG: CHAT domain-containing protein [Nonlabens sp.]
MTTVPKVLYTLKAIWCTVFLMLFISTVSAINHPISIQQDSTFVKLSDQVEQLYKSNQLKEVLSFCKKELPELIKANDSLEIAWLSYYKVETQGRLKDYLETIKTAEEGIKFSPNNEVGLEIKGILYYKKAYAEDQLNYLKRSLKSMQKSSVLLSQLKNSNDDYVIGAYSFLSNTAAYNGNLEEAQRYLRLAEKTYWNNKKEMDLARTEPDGNYDRYEVILPYKKTYILYKQGKTKKDSIEIERLVNTFEMLHAAPEFNAMYERVYYTTALNHVGDWYGTHKPDSLTTTADLEKAHYYLDKSIELVQDRGYPGNVITFQFNKCKALTLSNDLDEANSLISKLLKGLNENDGRRPYFLAQKGFIQAKLQQKDSALIAFYDAIQKVHSGDTLLKKDYSNFKPNENFNQTKLILRIAEKLLKYYKGDPVVQANVAQLYYMALIQFENSYNDKKFNKTYNEYLRQIVQGILKMKQLGYGAHLIKEKDFLNRFETIKNQLAWKQFNQNRYLNNLPKLDSLKQHKLHLRSSLVASKSEGDIRRQDSLYELINKTTLYTNSLFPNLELLSSKNFDVEVLQNKLKEDQLVLKYVLLDHQIAVYQITVNQVKVDLKPWSSNEKKLLNQFLISAKTQKVNEDLSRELSKILLPKISKNIKHLIVNPDGELYQLPFESIKVEEKYLIEIYRLSYTSNLGFIHPDLEKEEKSQELAIYIPDYAQSGITSLTRNKSSSLAGAQKEGRTIASLFPSKIYTDTTLTKEEFIETAREAGLLHLAMHAEVNSEEPELSRLLFNTTNEDTSRDLFLEELYALSLRADLAVLSACNTGTGKQNAGQNMTSFQRAFTFAGVPATVASLWEVPDHSTNQIMESFYEYLSTGLSKSQSLQNAKQDYIALHSGTKLEQPYYWAGFVVYGEDKPVTDANTNVLLYPFLAGFAVIAMIVFIVQRRKKDLG